MRIRLKHEVSATKVWWLERWMADDNEPSLIEGMNYAMLRVPEGLVVLRLPYNGEETDISDPDGIRGYVVVGRPETVEAGLLLIDLLAESV